MGGGGYAGAVQHSVTVLQQALWAVMVCSVLILNSVFKQSRRSKCRSVRPDAEAKRADRSLFDLSFTFCVDLFVSTQKDHT